MEQIQTATKICLDEMKRGDALFPISEENLSRAQWLAEQDVPIDSHDGDYCDAFSECVCQLSADAAIRNRATHPLGQGLDGPYVSPNASQFVTLPERFLTNEYVATFQVWASFVCRYVLFG